jgi:hypothetical protein
MCEYLKLKIENWKFYVKCLEFENLKTKMSKFGCVNIESWKLKTKIWNHAPSQPHDEKLIGCFPLHV